MSGKKHFEGVCQAGNPTAAARVLTDSQLRKALAYSFTLPVPEGSVLRACGEMGGEAIQRFVKGGRK